MSVTGMGVGGGGLEEDRAKFFVSAVVPSHIFITQPLPPGKKRASQGGRGKAA